MDDRVFSRMSTLVGSATLSVIGMLVAVTPAFATDPDVATSVASLPASVTLSTSALPTYAAYQFTLTHNSENEILRPVYVKATTAVVDGSGAPVSGQTAAFVASSLPAGCSAPTPSTLDCTFADGLVAAGAVKTFGVTVTAPTAGAKVKFTSTTSWKESYESEGTPASTVFTLLSAPDPSKVNTYVPTSTQPTTLFTGLGCAASTLFVGCPATSSQTWTTTVTIPASSLATTAEILQNIVPGGCASDLLTCSSSTLTIPGNFDHLEITLRRDASTIANGAKIANARISYDNPAHPAVGVIYPLDVPNCTDTTYGVLPQHGIPCIKLRTDYPKKSVPPKIIVPPEFGNDWEFVIWALDNGKYSN